MSLQYIANSSGEKMAVVIPINDWAQILKKYPDIESIEGDLAQWQKEIIDARLKTIANHPERLHPIEELFDELNRDSD